MRREGTVTSITRFAILAGLAALVLPAVSLAQPAAKAKGAPAAAQSEPTASANGTPPQPGWVARCASASRDAPLECAMEETAVLTKTGQLVVLVNIHIANDTRLPTAMVQLPLGINLPVGAKLQVDDGKISDLQIETCENRGCFASLPIPPDVLVALRSGKQLKIYFQNMGKETITVPMPLADFAAGYDKIK
jgi:invasion protein IalB